MNNGKIVGEHDTGGFWRDVGSTVVLLMVLVVLILCAVQLGGCAATVGSKADFDGAKASLVNGAPVTLDIRDKDKSGTASGVGPARYTSIGNDRVETMQTGTTPRDLFVRLLPDGTVQANLSSGTDITAKGVEFNHKTKAFKVAEFGTSASAPLKAGNEAYDRLVAYWQSRDEASKAALLAQIDAMKVTAPEFAAVLRAALGVP